MSHCLEAPSSIRQKINEYMKMTWTEPSTAHTLFANYNNNQQIKSLYL